ncbi:MAG: hypothetical protein ABSH20_21890 [Tepidisphaeraceae bacterium]
MRGGNAGNESSNQFMYLRTVKVPSSSGKINEYVRIVEAYRRMERPSTG